MIFLSPLLLQRRWQILGGTLLMLLVWLAFQIIFSWGLITIHAQGMPLVKVLRSIQRQGWVTIYTDIDPQTEVTMWVDRVPLAEAMETLAANLDQGTQWKLGFFTGPSAAAAKAAVQAFQSGDTADAWHIYSFPTPLTQVVGDSEMPVPSPYLFAWGGVKPSYLVQNRPQAVAAPGAGLGTGAEGTAPAVTSNQPVEAAEPEAPTVQTYLRAFALGTDVWIMSPSDWQAAAPSPPAVNSRVARAIKSFVGRERGTTIEALVLQEGHRRDPARGGRPAEGRFYDWSSTADRLTTSIAALPPELQENARQAVANEVQFQQMLQTAPPAQRRQMWQTHNLERRAYANNLWRRSPEKRAQMYQRMVAIKSSVLGKK